MQTITLPGENPESISSALSLIRDGEIVAFPTDTVYGLGADPFQATGIIKLFEAKGRDSNKAIAILIGSIEQASLVTDHMPDMAIRLCEVFWPGMLTVIVPRKNTLPELISNVDRIGIRMPNHPVALEMLRTYGPLATTSANLSGKPDAITAKDVFDQLANRVPLILDGGKCQGGVPSTVIDCSGSEPVILREGPVSIERLFKVLEIQKA
ncbi:MAG: threonylcarbamoyl-AMP synthase [Chloroflexi bacterium HGW-Chloroflexi-5]|jgi:L-threonylcarbamoyladenylate synthase|nr:MAG: threonylcarbamoyl-AMP synthase [Chloroflexi bacterium HGW-Chloroflexi-5]